MILFYCPECAEGLEADEEIRGTRMECPSCGKSITVPQEGVAPPSARSGKPSRGEREVRPSTVGGPGRMALWLTLLLSVVAVLVVVALRASQTARTEDQRAPCSACSGRRQVVCGKCSGQPKLPCVECGGDGKKANFRGEEETCVACTGAGTVSCRICGGEGEYDCQECDGTGKEGKKP